MSGRSVPEQTTVADLERLASESLPAATFEYFQTGARREITAAANEAAWQAWWLAPHVLADVSSVSLRTTVLGQVVDTPILAAPMGIVHLAHADGDVAIASATAAAGSIAIVSQTSMSPLADIAAVPDVRFWVQHYPLSDRRADEQIVRAAVSAGAGAIVITVDFPLRSPTRSRPVGGFDFPPAESFPPEAGRGYPVLTAPTMDYLTWIREIAAVPVVVKGVIHRADAAKLADGGIDAIVVSNHGGRALDGVLPTADVLPEIADAVGDRTEVYVDGGIRRGGDVLRALALGARAVLIGRPLVWGLACAGADGVGHVLATLSRELEEDLALCGVNDVTAIPREVVRRRDSTALH